MQNLSMRRISADRAMVLVLLAVVYFYFMSPAKIFASEFNPKQNTKGKKLNEHNRASAPGARFYPIIMDAALRYDVDPALVMAIIDVESRYDPQAVSPKGAAGLMQLMPATARYLGVSDCHDPGQNVDAGVRYFKEMQNRFDGDIKLALAAYNAGKANVLRYGGVPPFAATIKYIDEVLLAHERYVGRIEEIVVSAIE